MWKRIKAYLKRKLAGERFGRLFNNLANGNLVITTNDFLRWTIFVGTTAFLLTYLDFRMDYYIKSNIKILKDIETASVSNIELYHTIMENAHLLKLNSYGIPETTFFNLGESAQISYIIFMQKLMLQGLSIEAFGIILQVISLIRLIILSIRFNIPTGLVMVIISYLASYAYYIDLICELKDLSKDVLRMIYGFPYNRRITNEIIGIKNLYFKNTRSLFYPVQNLVANVLEVTTYQKENIYTDSEAEAFKEFYNDPLSLVARIVFQKMDSFYLIVMRRLPENWRYYKLVDNALKGTFSYAFASYYYIIEQIITPTVKFTLNLGFQSRYFILYMYIVRRGKEWMPYLIRWHWQLILVMEPLKKCHVTVIRRIGKYVRAVLRPNYRTAKRELDIWQMFYKKNRPWVEEIDLQANLEMARFKLEIAYTCQYFLILVFISCYVYAALHAVCGQYFFIPVLTQNVELHTGYRRDSLSVYSGGYTSWQDLDDSVRWRKMWHGVLGRGTDNAPLILIIFDFIKNLLVKLFRFFKR